MALPKFIQTAIETNASQMAEHDLPDLVDLLTKEMGGYEKARGYAKIHASDITKGAFCPRAVALGDITGKAPKDEYVPAALRATFDAGNAISDLLRTKWFGEHAFGNWRCRVCRTMKSHCSQPEQTGNHFCTSDLNGAYQRCDWQYEEIEFVSQPLQVSGSLDVLIKHGLRLMVVEIKIMAPDEFATLLAPLAEHRVRTSLYMRLVEESSDPYKSMIMTDRAKVLYVSRAYGKMHGVAGQVLPFKQFTVARDDSALVQPIAKAMAVRKWREDTLIPAGICATLSDPKAKKCSVCAECFSGGYPAFTHYIL